MKKTLFALILFAAWNASAQGVQTLQAASSHTAYPNVLGAGPGDVIWLNQPEYVYAEIVGTAKLLSFGTKVTVEIDYGQKWSLITDKRIRDDGGKVMAFNSMVDAMNYMGEGGWEFVQAYTITSGNTNVYHWLMRADKDKMSFIPATK